jgi:hypothetical protein
MFRDNQSSNGKKQLTFGQNPWRGWETFAAKIRGSRATKCISGPEVIVDCGCATTVLLLAKA